MSFSLSYSKLCGSANKLVLSSCFSSCIMCFSQVRESIGVTLSVLCSNIRLHESFSHLSSHNGGSTDASKNLEVGNWDQYLVQRASELAMTIQNVSPSDISEILTDQMTDNEITKDHSRDGVNWMETVVTFCKEYII